MFILGPGDRSGVAFMIYEIQCNLACLIIDLEYYSRYVTYIIINPKWPVGWSWKRGVQILWQGPHVECIK